MPKLREAVQKVRSKNAGPFWITVDVFCGSAEAFETVRRSLKPAQVAQVYDVPTQTLKHFEMPDLNVIKYSFPRPHAQGTAQDRDLHGASYAELLAELDLT